jgi:UDP-N-acetylmuramate dehydrogenase
VTQLADYTTLGLGGPAKNFVTAATDAALTEAVRTADAASEPVLLLGGGSNLVIADDGFDGTVIHIATRGLRFSDAEGPGPAAPPAAATSSAPSVDVTVAAGERWDDVVAATVDAGLAGLECLSGIPGRAGAVPVQNVGAYGVEIAEPLVDVDLYDRRAGTVRRRVPAAALALGYRTSVLKGRDDAVVLRVRLRVSVGALSGPIRYAELARVLDVPPGARVPAGAVREAVLALRRSKGMVLDPADRDTWSVGSFFTNPVVSAADAARVRAGSPSEPPEYPAAGGRTKLSAAWLITRAGFERGHPGPGGRVALSTKHALALTHRGGGRTADLLALAREVRDGVRDRFGITLTPEPVLVGCTV